jgi:hypothetical protein
MVNLNKWEEIKFEDVQEGDIIKSIVWSDTDKFKTRSVCTSKIGVHSRWGGGFGADNLTILTGQLTKDFKRTIYRRKAKAKADPPFVFPTAKGAIIAGDGTANGEVELVNIGAGLWFSLTNTGKYTEKFLSGFLKNLRVVSEGTRV